MLYPELLRTLYLPTTPKSAPRRWLSAASGLVHSHGRLYLIADDEHSLYHVAFDPAQPALQDAPLLSCPLLPGELPADRRARKQAKPDLETLMLLPATPAAPQGRLLCLGSGGRLARRRAVEIALGTDGSPGESVIHDLSGFFDTLHASISDLNIEGGFLLGDRLCLLQRGNKAPGAHSALLTFDAKRFLRWLGGDRCELPQLQSRQSLDFGNVEGVPLCPTDAALLPDGSCVLSLVAEDTSDSVADGRCVAAALARLNPQGELVTLERLHGAPKIEGVALATTAIAGTVLPLLLVTDADDPDQPSTLLHVEFP